MKAPVIAIAANSDLRFDQRLMRISASLREAGFRVKATGRNFGNTGISEEEFGRHLKLWFRKGKAAYLELNVRLLFVLLSGRQDIICSVDLDTLPACWLAAKIRRVKLVQDSHEYMAEVPEVAGRPLTKKIWNLVASLFLPGCDLRYTVSQSLVEEFRKEYGLGFELIRNMALLRDSGFPEDLPAGIPKGDYLCFLGAVNRGRGLEELISVLETRKEVLVVLGEGDVLEEVKDMVRKKGMESRIIFCGRVDPATAVSVLKNARAGINLLRDEGLSYRYSLANKFFDYVHAGIPQICIDFPEYTALMSQHQVGIACSLTRESIAGALDEMESESRRAEYVSETGKARLEWNWQKESRKLIELYRKLSDI